MCCSRLGFTCRQFHSSCKLKVCIAGALTDHCVTHKRCHLEMLQPLWIDLQMIPVLTQGEQVNTVYVLGSQDIFLQQQSTCQLGCM